MTIEEFLRGNLKLGYESAIILTADGRWGVSAYEHGDLFRARYKEGQGASFADAIAAFLANDWRPPTEAAIAAAQAAGGWPGSGGTG